MWRPDEVWTRTVPDSVEVDGDTARIIETHTEVSLHVGLTGRVSIGVDVLRGLLLEAGYERKHDA